MLEKIVQPLLGRLGIGLKLGMTPILSTLVLIGILAYTILSIQGQESDAVVVDLAGRQRMLNQRQTTEVILASQNFEADYRATRKLLASTLEALLHGGEAVINPATGATVVIPPAPTEQLRAKLEENRSLLEDFDLAAAALLASNPQQADYPDKLAALLETRNRVHTAANQAVRLFTANSDAKLSAMLTNGFVITGVIAVLGALFAWVMARHILTPLSRTLRVLEAVARGELTTRLSITNRDELGRMATALNRVIDDVHQAVQADRVNWQQVAEQRRELHRTQQIIDNTATCILYADPQLDIQYLNPASRATLQSLKAHLPVPVEQLTGHSVDCLGVDRKALSHRLAAQGSEPLVEITELGGEKLKLEFTALNGEEGRSVLLTWSVVTRELENQHRVREAAEKERHFNDTLKEQVAQLLDVVQAAGKGDLTREVTVRGQDAMGQVGEGLARLLGDLRGDIREIGDNARLAASAAKQMRAISQQMNDNALRNADDAEAASQGAEQVSNRVESVAAATEEMNTSIREIARSTADASQVTGSAVTIAASTGEIMRRLDSSSGEIDSVIKTITAIAEQTNLLALNATIEAARAGEAGKGFAVVANEVKELAKATAKATDDIGRMISGIQGDTREAVEAIGQIATIIDRVSDIQTTVAGAVEEQTAVTNEISRNVADAASGSSEIAHSITRVAGNAQDTTRAGQEVYQAAGELARVAGQLESLVSKFRYQ